MEIEFDLTKSVEENASKYFEESKKAKKKLEGAKKALAETKKKLDLLLKQESQFLEEQAQKLIKKEAILINGVAKINLVKIGRAEESKTRSRGEDQKKHCDEVFIF